jgi:hypothetical protein
MYLPRWESDEKQTERVNPTPETAKTAETETILAAHTFPEPAESTLLSIKNGPNPVKSRNETRTEHIFVPGNVSFSRRCG